MLTNRDEIRQFFIDAWAKHRHQEPLSDLEQQLVAIIQMHPEYHRQLTNHANIIDKDYSSEQNPFLHMGLHLSLIEQLTTNRPPGIVQIYQQLCHQMGDAHTAEHCIMDVIGHLLWDAQQNKTLPSDDDYMARLKRLLHKD